MDGKVSVVFNRNCFPKITDFTRLGDLQAVTYTVKNGSIEEMVRDRHIVTNRKYYVTYLFVPYPHPMTLDDLKGHSPNAGLIKCNSTNISVTFSK